MSIFINHKDERDISLFCETFKWLFGYKTMTNVCERQINHKLLWITFLVRENHLPVVLNSIVNRARWLFFLNALIANA
jgi:hypothetical protein